MKITVVENQASDAYINFAKMLSERAGSKMHIAAIIFIIAGFALITYDLINFNKCKFKIGSEIRVNDKLVKNDVECYNLHLGLGAGLAFLFFGYMVFVQNNKLDRIETKKIYTNSKRYYSASNEQWFVFSEDHIAQSNNYFKSEIKWDIASKYSEKNGYLVIYDEDISDALVFVRRRVISETDYAELISLLNSKLTKM